MIQIKRIDPKPIRQCSSSGTFFSSCTMRGLVLGVCVGSGLWSQAEILATKSKQSHEALSNPISSLPAEEPWQEPPPLHCRYDHTTSVRPPFGTDFWSESTKGPSQLIWSGMLNLQNPETGKITKFALGLETRLALEKVG